MNTRKSHKSRQTQMKTATAKGSPIALLAESAGGDASSSVPTAPTQTLLPAIQGQDGADLAESGMPAGDQTKPVVVLPPPIDAKPYWYRKPDSKVRKMVEKIIILRAAGIVGQALAKKLGTTEGTISQAMYLARKNNWLNDDESDLNDIEAELALDVERKVVRNISHSLDGGMTNWQTHEMTIAAAKGRGIFKNHEKSENTAAPSMTAVAIKVIMPSIGVSDQNIIEENVGGMPAYIEGEVEDGAE